jgi:hypothetical protein
VQVDTQKLPTELSQSIFCRGPVPPLADFQHSTVAHSDRDQQVSMTDLARSAAHERHGLEIHVREVVIYGVAPSVGAPVR